MRVKVARICRSFLKHMVSPRPKEMDMIHQPALTIESIRSRFVNCSPRPRQSHLRDSHDTNSRPPAENHENHETLHFCSQRRYESKASVQDQNGDNTFETYHYTGTYLKPNHNRCVFSKGCPTLRTALSINPAILGLIGMSPMLEDPCSSAHMLAAFVDVNLCVWELLAWQDFLGNGNKKAKNNHRFLLRRIATMAYLSTVGITLQFDDNYSGNKYTYYQWLILQMYLDTTHIIFILLVG